MIKIVICSVCLILLLLSGCNQNQIGIVYISINCSEVDCSCKVNDYCKSICDGEIIRNDQNWDRVEFNNEPICVCS